MHKATLRDMQRRVHLLRRADLPRVKNTMKTFRRTHFSCLPAAAMDAAMHAAAQPTGNPKGATAPTNQHSSHPGTSRPSGDARRGEAATDPDAPAARDRNALPSRWARLDVRGEAADTAARRLLTRVRTRRTEAARHVSDGSHFFSIIVFFFKLEA